MRRGLTIIVTILFLAVAGWWAFERYGMLLPGLVMDWQDPIGPTEAVRFAAGPDHPEHPPEERPPNIVLIVADDLGWNDISFYGGGVAGGSVRTPNIDGIGRAGVHFTNGYAGSATCAPSRAAIMTGRYPTRFGYEFTPMPGGMARMVTRFAGHSDEVRRPPVLRPVDGGGEELSFEAMGVPQSEITLADLLRAHDYRTIHLGKWHLGQSGGSVPPEQGFDESVNLAGLLYAPADAPYVVNAPQEFDPIDRFLWSIGRAAVRFNEGPRFEPDAYLTDYLTEHAVAAIEANRNRPFFLYLAHWAPHTPLQALRTDYDALAHIDDHSLRVYAAMIRALDRSVGAVLDALRKHGLEENTLVMFTSDNGGAHYVGLSGLNDPYRGWKATFFGGGIRTPLFLRWPTRIEPGQHIDGMSHHFDLFATAAAAAGAPLPSDRIIDGRNLLPFVTGESAGAPHDVLFWRSGHYQAVIANGWKLQVAERPPSQWLFHLESDPTEHIDVAAKYPEKVSELTALLAEHNAAQVAPLWQSRVELPVSIDKHIVEPESDDDVFVYWPN